MSDDGYPEGRRPRGRALTQDEQDLWREMMRDATPLRREPYVLEQSEPSAAPQSGADDQAGPRQGAAARRPLPMPPRATPPPAPKPKPDRGLRSGELHALDRRMADRFRRGELRIDARLDLHGMTRAAAQDRLLGFLERAAERGHRCVLVITGKGNFSAEGGVLRRDVPHWLNMPHLRPKIVAFTEAQPRHGGSGALYVLLRRRREG